MEPRSHCEDHSAIRVSIGDADSVEEDKTVDKHVKTELKRSTHRGEIFTILESSDSRRASLKFSSKRHSFISYKLSPINKLPRESNTHTK